MAKIVVLGAGIAGHTASTFLRKYLGKNHEIIVIAPNSKWNWIPSNVWVGVGLMGEKDVTFPLAPLYERKKIKFYQAKALSIHPEGDLESNNQPFVTIEYTDPQKNGVTEKVVYDFLVNATGPKLNFGATPGLGPEGYSHSICSYSHALDANAAFQESLDRMAKGEKQRFVIGMGHGMCTCQGAAFEYLFNVEHEIRRKKLRDKAEIIMVSNEYELGDFGVGGMHISRGGYIVSSKIFTESLYAERGIKWYTRSHVHKVDKGEIHMENLAAEQQSVKGDFMMLIPPFAGVGLKAADRNGNDITSELFAPNGFMKVDADYTAKPYEQWKADDWPETYQNPKYKNIFAVGIAFAPPHGISKPMENKNGVKIFPTPPRTGMPSAMMAKAVAQSIRDMILRGKEHPSHKASMAKLGAACVASAGASLISGTAAAITMYPIVPDFERFPKFGRSLFYTTGEIGLSAHWIKYILHHMFIYKAKMKPFWSLIPE